MATSFETAEYESLYGRVLREHGIDPDDVADEHVERLAKEAFPEDESDERSISTKE